MNSPLGDTMKRFALAAALLVPLGVVLTLPSAPNADEDEIRTAVEHYFMGMMQGSAERLAIAFHPESRLIGVGREGAMIIPFARWAEGWQGRPPLDAETYRNAIVSVDIHGSAAVAKTVLEWPDVRYVDYLSLLKVNGEWKIVNKIWDESRP